MGTLSEKLKYLGETKKAILEAIIGKGVDVPEGTPFRRYPEYINAIEGNGTGELPDVPEGEEDVNAAYYSYHGLVLPDNGWDRDTYPFGIMYKSGDVITFKASAFQLGSKKGIIASFHPSAVVNAPYVTSTFDPNTQKWSAFELTSEGTSTVSYTSLVWTNEDATPLENDGRVSVSKSHRQPVYYDPNRPTAYIYTDGTMTFKNHGMPDSSKTVLGTFIDWDIIEYKEGENKTGLYQIPWNHLGKSVTRVTIDSDVTVKVNEIRKWFYGFENLTSINRIPSGAKVLYNLFEECRKLSSIPAIPSTVTKLDNRMFYGTLITSFTVPSHVTELGWGVFMQCESLTSVTLPETLTSIGGQCFRWTPKLTSITIPAKVDYIAQNAFGYGSGHLKYAYFKDTSGWWVASTEEATSGTSVNVSNASTAASLLIGTYNDYWWHKD